MCERVGESLCACRASVPCQPDSRRVRLVRFRGCYGELIFKPLISGQRIDLWIYKLSPSTASPLGGDKTILELLKRGWLHKTVNVRNATEVCSLQLLILCYMNSPSIRRKFIITVNVKVRKLTASGREAGVRIAEEPSGTEVCVNCHWNSRSVLLHMWSQTSSISIIWKPIRKKTALRPHPRLIESETVGGVWQSEF